MVELTKEARAREQKPSVITDFHRAIGVDCARVCSSAAQELIMVLHKRCIATNGRSTHWWYFLLCELLLWLCFPGYFCFDVELGR